MSYYSHEGKNDEVIKLGKEAKEHGMLDSNSVIPLLLAYRATKQFKEFIATAEEAIKNGIAYGSVYKILMEVYLKITNQYTEIVRIGEKARENQITNPKNVLLVPGSYEYLMLAYDKLGKPEKAIEIGEEGRTKKYICEEAYTILIKCYYKLGQD